MFTNNYLTQCYLQPRPYKLSKISYEAVLILGPDLPVSQFVRLKQVTFQATGSQGNIQATGSQGNIQGDQNGLKDNEKPLEQVNLYSYK